MSMGSRGLTASAVNRASPVAWLSVPSTARQKRRRSASSRFEREPRDRARRAARRDPRAQQRALARTGGGGQQRQRTLHAGVEGVEQPAARHHRASARAAR